MPADSYMSQHLKHVAHISHKHKPNPPPSTQRPSTPIDSFMTDFHKKAREQRALKKPFKASVANLPADAYLFSQMKEIKHKVRPGKRGREVGGRSGETR